MTVFTHIVGIRPNGAVTLYDTVFDVCIVTDIHVIQYNGIF